MDTGTRGRNTKSHPGCGWYLAPVCPDVPVMSLWLLSWAQLISLCYLSCLCTSPDHFIVYRSILPQSQISAFIFSLKQSLVTYTLIFAFPMSITFHQYPMTIFLYLPHCFSRLKKKKVSVWLWYKSSDKNGGHWCVSLPKGFWESTFIARVKRMIFVSL